MTVFQVAGERLAADPEPEWSDLYGGWVGRWEPFQRAVEAESVPEARWVARRAESVGTTCARLEDLPPNPERESVEVSDPEHEREEQRSRSEREEYDRLVSTVKITSVTEA